MLILNRNIKLLYLVLCCLSIFSSHAQTLLFKSNDIKLLLGEWKGTLTYLDYSSNKPYTMPSEVSIRPIPKTNQLIFSNIYPDEPKANKADTVLISHGGQMIDNEIVKKRIILNNMNIEIVTEYKGVDGNDNAAAIIRHTYTLCKTIFVKRKEVQFVGKSEWIKRNEYAYHRKV